MSFSSIRPQPEATMLSEPRFGFYQNPRHQQRVIVGSTGCETDSGDIMLQIENPIDIYIARYPYASRKVTNECN